MIQAIRNAIGPSRNPRHPYAPGLWPFSLAIWAHRAPHASNRATHTKKTPTIFSSIAASPHFVSRTVEGSPSAKPAGGTQSRSISVSRRSPSKPSGVSTTPPPTSCHGDGPASRPNSASTHPVCSPSSSTTAQYVYGIHSTSATSPSVPDVHPASARTAIKLIRSIGCCQLSTMNKTKLRHPMVPGLSKISEIFNETFSRICCGFRSYPSPSISSCIRRAARRGHFTNVADPRLLWPRPLVNRDLRRFTKIYGVFDSSLVSVGRTTDPRPLTFLEAISAQSGGQCYSCISPFCSQPDRRG